VDVDRDTGRNPLFDVMFILQQFNAFSRHESSFVIKPFLFSHKVSKFDITLTAMENEDTLLFYFEYSRVLFHPASIQRFITYYKNILENIIHHPGVQIGNIGMITVKEKKQILHEFNNTTAPFPSHATIDQLMEEQVRRHPGGIALRWEDKTSCYREFSSKGIIFVAFCAKMVWGRKQLSP
jgi:non-ribosomal peptide synthetase component F